MAWGFRRSLRIAGPLRLNFSKSGLGLSFGVPGLHVGVSPKRRPYLRAGVPGTGIYYRKSLKQPRPVHTKAPKPAAIETPWMQAVRALLDGDAQRAFDIASTLKPSKGPAVHIEVGEDVVVTLLPDACGIAVIKAEAMERLGRKDDRNSRGGRARRLPRRGDRRARAERSHQSGPLAAMPVRVNARVPRVSRTPQTCPRRRMTTRELRIVVTLWIANLKRSLRVFSAITLTLLAKKE